MLSVLRRRAHFMLSFLSNSSKALESIRGRSQEKSCCQSVLQHLKLEFQKGLCTFETIVPYRYKDKTHKKTLVQIFQRARNENAAYHFFEFTSRSKNKVRTLSLQFPSWTTLGPPLITAIPKQLCIFS